MERNVSSGKRLGALVVVRGLLAIAVASLGLAAGCGDSDGADGASGATGGAAGSQQDASVDGEPVDASSEATSDAQPADTGHDEPVIPTEHPRILFDPEVRSSLTDKLSQAEPAATRFRNMVDGQLGGADYYGFQAWNAALLYQLTGEPQYADYAIAIVDANVTSEEALIASGERAEVAFDSYLYVGETIGDLAMTYDWCFDRLTSEQKSRWIAYADQAVWNVWHPDDAVWGGVPYPWSGWSTSNPSNNYYYSFLRATMLMGLATKGESAAADDWLTTFRDDKIGAELVPAFAADLAGGGSREGTGYGVAMARLFELYYLWEHSTGERIADLTPHARESLLYLIHETVPTLDRIAPIGDHSRDSSAALFDYHRNYGLVLVKLFAGTREAEVGRSFLADCSVTEMGSAFMFANDFLYGAPEVPLRSLDELTPAWNASGTGHTFFRSSWDTDATWWSLIAGPYTESHAHHDQGSLLVYKNEWLAFDENILSHSGIRPEEELHNLVRLELAGETIPMHEGAGPARLTALQRSDRFVHVAAAVTPAFDGNPSVSKLERELVYLPSDTVVVFDRVSSNDPLDAIWQLNTPATATVGAQGRVGIQGSVGRLDIIPVLLPSGVTPGLVDWQALDSDTSGGTRVQYAQSVDGTGAFFLTVLSLDGAVATVVERPAATTRGVQLDFSDGSAAWVDFVLDGEGGELTLFDDQGAQVLAGPLETGVESLPAFVP